jgi:hypothetical protein
MMKLMIVLFSFYLCSLPIMAGAQQRAGISRGHEVDILRDTFAFSAKDIDVDIKSVYQGCQKRDCIPSIDRPKFLAANKVDYLEPDDIILSVTHGGVTRGYPTRILDRHEIVNDRFAEIPVAVTYCPLCGSGLAFIRSFDGVEVELGVSGLLHNNDLIMYDRRTESLWQQITGKAIAGPKRGSVLKSIPLTMSMWADWKNAHPGAEVLTFPGDPERYSKVAYGNYASSDRLLFPVSSQDARLHVKKLVYGVEIAEQSIALESAWLLEKGAWEHEINGQLVRLEVGDDGAVRATFGGQSIIVHRMYWFAWYSFHPDTSLID